MWCKIGFKRIVLWCYIERLELFQVFVVRRRLVNAFVPFEFEFFFSSSSFVVAFVAFVVVAVVEGTTPFGGTNSWAEGVNGMCATSNNAFECVPPSDEARALQM